MENQSATTSSSMQMQFLLLEQVQFLQVNDDSLLQWELVDVVDAEEEEEEEDEDEQRRWLQGEGDVDGDSIQNGFGSWNSPISYPIDAPIEGIRCLLLHRDADVEDHDDDHDDGYGGGEVDDVDVVVDDDDDDDGYGLDDELVPWNVSNKLGRQRMRKLGKRAFSKMQNSKRSPNLFMRPGCVRGKHGLGLKHTL